MSVIHHNIGIFVECILFSYEEINYAMFVKREGRIQDFYFMVRTPEAHEAPEFFSASLLTLARAHLIDSKLFNIIPYIFMQVRKVGSQRIKMKVKSKVPRFTAWKHRRIQGDAHGAPHHKLSAPFRTI